MKKTKIDYTRELRCSYLYSNGTLMQWFEEKRDGLKIGETVDITYGYADVRLFAKYEDSTWAAKKVEGRIVLSDRYDDSSIVRLMRGAKVEAIAPSLQGGSENTKRLGIGVGYFKIITKSLKLSWTVMDGLISSIVTIQTDAQSAWRERGEGQTWSVGAMWGDLRVAKVTDLRPKVEPVQTQESVA